MQSEFGKLKKTSREGGEWGVVTLEEDSDQVQRGFFKQIKKFRLYPEGNGKATRGWKQASVTIFSFPKIPLASVQSKN